MSDLVPFPKRDRWKALVEEAAHLEKDPHSMTALVDAVGFLDRVLTLFPLPEDPVQDREGYAVHQAASAMRATLLMGRAVSYRLGDVVPLNPEKEPGPHE